MVLIAFFLPFSPSLSLSPSSYHPNTFLLQLVTNEYKAVRFIRLQLLALSGYVVVVVDGRGSSRRGVDFETALSRQMVSFDCRSITWYRLESDDVMTHLGFLTC